MYQGTIPRKGGLGDWNYEEHEVLLSMKDCVTQALAQFKHETPKQFYYGPSKVDHIQYGAKIQYSKPINKSIITFNFDATKWTTWVRTVPCAMSIKTGLYTCIKSI